jgi:type IV pilus assembly protein PilB
MVLYKRFLSKPIGEILIEKGVITREQLLKALELQKKESKLIGEILINLGIVKEEEVAQALTMQYGLPYLPLKNYELNPEIIKLIPKELAHKYSLIAIDKIGNTLTISITDLLDQEIISQIEKLTNSNVQFFVSTASDIKDAYKRYYQD